METKFRPLPLSIVDFFGVVVPGFVWLLLFITAGLMFSHDGPSTPVDAWYVLAGLVRDSGTWLGPLAVILIAAVIGYAMKPRAMRLAMTLAAPMLKIFSERFRGIPLREVTFPFTRLYERKGYYRQLRERIAELTCCELSTLPAHQPFSTAKRLLRLIAPSLWEELEHREAEVRLLGAAFLAGVFSVLLAAVELLRELPDVSSATKVWLLTSAGAAILLGDGYGYLRVGEVDFTYLHTQLALTAREKKLIGPASGASSDSE